MTNLTVVIPAYNEEIAIASIIHLSSKYANEIIVIDDGSTDRTSEVAELAGATVLHHSTNLGKGAALKTAFNYACDYDILVTIDADGQHNPDEIPMLIKPILDNEADIVNGSRYLNGQDTETPTYRRVGQTVLDTATNIAANIKLTDTQSGFRAFSAESLSHFNLNSDDFSIESDMLIEASKNNLIIKEVEITVRYDVNTTRANPVIQGLTVLMRILEIMRFNRPLYFYGVGGGIILFIGMLMWLSLSMSVWASDVHLLTISFFIMAIGIILIFSGIMTDTLNRFKN